MVAPLLSIMQSEYGELDDGSKISTLRAVAVTFKDTLYTHDHATTSNLIGRCIVHSSRSQITNPHSVSLKDHLYCTSSSTISLKKSSTVHATRPLVLVGRWLKMSSSD